MSTEKQTNEKVVSKRDVVVDATPVLNVDVLALEIDDDFDVGSDPYNKTGSHCIIKVPEDD